MERPQSHKAEPGKCAIPRVVTYPVQGNEREFHVIEAKEYSARRTF
jgi:hypothetical protein